MKTIKDVDEYIAGFPAATQKKLVQLRSIIKKNAPMATEMISYGIAAYKLNKSPLIYFAGFKNHVGVYPAPVKNPAFIEALSPYKTGKGSVQLPLDKALPRALIEKIIAFRLSENQKKTAAKRTGTTKKIAGTNTELEKLTAYMDKLDVFARPTVRLLRTILKKAGPALGERIKWSAPSYHINGIDLFTFGPLRKGKVLLVFHHPAIVTIKSKLLEGTFKDRRLISFDSESDVVAKQSELEKIVKALIPNAT